MPASVFLDLKHNQPHKSESWCIQSAVVPLFLEGCTGWAGVHGMLQPSLWLSFAHQNQRVQDERFYIFIPYCSVVYHSNVEKLEKKNYGKMFVMRLFLQLRSSLKPEDKTWICFFKVGTQWL